MGIWIWRLVSLSILAYGSSSQVQISCNDDREKLCAHDTHSADAEINACLSQHKKALSAACLEALEKHSACVETALTFMKACQVPEREVYKLRGLQCLIQHKESLGPECAYLVDTASEGDHRVEMARASHFDGGDTDGDNIGNKDGDKGPNQHAQATGDTTAAGASPPEPSSPPAASSLSTPGVDFDMHVKRHRGMELETMATAIREAEQDLDVVGGCSDKHGVAFIEHLNASRTLLCDGGPEGTVVERYRASNGAVIWQASNFQLTELSSEFDDTFDKRNPKLTHSEFGVACKDTNDEKWRDSFADAVKQSSMRPKVKMVDSLDCDSWVEHPVLILPFLDMWNLWHLAEYGLLPACTALAVTESHLKQQGHPQVMTMTMDGWMDDAPGFWMPLTEALKALVSENYHEVWVVPRDGIPPKTCFRRMVMAFHTPSDLITPGVGSSTDCPSPITSGCANLLRARMGLPTKPQNARPRVLFIGRDNSRSNLTNWNSHQYGRMIDNQDTVVKFLSDQCEVAGYDFSFLAPTVLADLPTAQEQALRSGWADVLVGIHGAGLTLMLFMAPGSGVVEIHKGSGGNRHYQNLAKKLGFTYETVSAQGGASLSNGTLDNIWTNIAKVANKVKPTKPE